VKNPETFFAEPLECFTKFPLGFSARLPRTRRLRLIGKSEDGLPESRVSLVDPSLTTFLPALPLSKR